MFGKKERCAVCGEKLSFTAIQINGMNTTISISNPPLKAADYLENAMNE